MLFLAMLHTVAAGELSWDLPLADVPFNLHDGGYTWPSMEQSLQTSVVFYSATHRFLQPFELDDPRLSRRVAGRLVLFAADFALPLLPGGSTWLHEEWHRAVLTRHGTPSHNGVYDFQPGLFVSVDHVADEDLVRLKDTSAPDQVRLSTAGIEALGVLSTELWQVQFFDAPDTYPVPVYWLAALTNGIYYGLCASPRNTAGLDAEVAGEGPDVSTRDFTGLDCTGFTYDLHRPDEPYDARGPHPSGVGVDRYRTWDDLTDGEQAWLTRQSRLTWLNLVNPALLELDAFPLEVGRRVLRVNARLEHMPAPFGHRVGALALLETGGLRLAAGLHVGVSEHLVRPQLSLAARDVALGMTACTVAGDLWVQPTALRFDAQTGQIGGRVRGRVALDLGRAWQPYVALEAKTAGWVPGRVALGPEVSMKSGVTVRVAVRD